MSEFIEELKKKMTAPFKMADRFCQTCETVTKQKKPGDSWICTICGKYQISLQ